MPTNDYTATNADGVTYALTYNPLGLNYTLVITYPPGGGTTQTITGIPATNVLTASGGTLTIATLLGSSTYVVPPGVSGTVSITAAIASSNTVYVGGTATIDSAVSALSGLTIYVDGGSASVANGDIAGALSGSTVYLDNGGTFSNGSAVATVLDNTTINFGLNGGTFLVNAGGAVIDLSSTTINDFVNGSDNLEFENLAGPVDSYSITTSGSSQTIELFGAGGTDLGTVTVAGTTFPTGTVTQGESGPLTITSDGANVTVTAASSIFTCFLAGTLIRTPSGDVAIEDLRDGDFVLTPTGERLQIRAIAVNRISTRFTDPRQVMPIQIAEGAFAEGLPMRDLYVSPDHSFYFDGFLIPAQLLVNGMSIRQITRSGPIDYYHIELEPHALIVAEGVATESFLDTGVQWRWSARRSMTSRGAAEPKTWEDACAPLLLSGPLVDEIRARLEARATASMAPLTAAA